MNSEGPKKQEVKMPLTEEDIEARDKAKTKNIVWFASAAALGAMAAASEVGEAVSNSFNKDILTSESFSYKLDKPADENLEDEDKERVDIILEGESVGSFGMPTKKPNENTN